MDKILGVDFSHWQSKVDFQKLLDNNIKFAIFKAGEIPTKSKTEYLDDMYARNIREAKEHNLISGAYYFFHPVIGASRQARHFHNIMQAYGVPDLPPVIDCEHQDGATPQDYSAVLKAMIDHLMNDYGYRRPIIYSRWGFLVNQMGWTKLSSTEWYKDHYLWLAQYSTQLTYKPRDMSNVIMWQFTDRMRLPGIGVNLDGNYWLKSEAELMELAGKSGGQPEKPEHPYLTDEYQKKWKMFKTKEGLDAEYVSVWKRILKYGRAWGR